MTRMQLIIFTGLVGLFIVFVVRGVGLGKPDPLDERVQKLGRATGPVLAIPNHSNEAAKEGDEKMPSAIVKDDEHQRIFSGEVQQAIDASRYTYIQFLSEAGEMAWAAVPKVTLSKGETVSIVESLTMENFESKTLGRIFPRVVFGVLLRQGSQESTDAGTSDNAIF